MPHRSPRAGRRGERWLVRAVRPRSPASSGCWPKCAGDGRQRGREAAGLGKAADYAIRKRELETNIILKSSDVPAHSDVNVQSRQRALNLLWFAQAGYIELSDDYLSQWRSTANVDEGPAVPPPVIASTASATNYMAEYASLVEAAMKTKAAAWMRVARGGIGQREIPGPASNSRIVAYNQAAGLPADDAVLWVGSFMCWTFKPVGKPCPAAPGRALSWETWGRENEGPGDRGGGRSRSPSWARS